MQVLAKVTKSEMSYDVHFPSRKVFFGLDL